MSQEILVELKKPLGYTRRRPYQHRHDTATTRSSTNPPNTDMVTLQPFNFYTTSITPPLRAAPPASTPAFNTATATDTI